MGHSGASVGWGRRLVVEEQACKTDRLFMFQLCPLLSYPWVSDSATSSKWGKPLLALR